MKHVQEALTMIILLLAFPILRVLSRGVNRSDGAYHRGREKSST